MREFKFRAFDKDRYFMEYIHDFYWFEEEGVHDSSGDGHYTNYILMQYTGLKDSKGKEIYEGDIVEERWNNPLTGGEKVDRYKVETAENSLIKMIHSSGKQQWDRYLYMRHKDVEVIGNIYDMPDWDF
jgi:uncharacterized phage protein (TIGR01671 family)